MKNIILKFLLSLILFTTCGCLWILRVPFPKNEKFDDNGYRTNVVYSSVINEFRIQNKTEVESNKIDFVEGIYPLTKARVFFTCCAFSPKDFSNLKGDLLFRKRVHATLAPFAAILLWFGEPLDLIVDTIILPWDLSE